MLKGSTGLCWVLLGSTGCHWAQGPGPRPGLGAVARPGCPPLAEGPGQACSPPCGTLRALVVQCPRPTLAQAPSRAPHCCWQPGLAAFGVSVELGGRLWPSAGLGQRDMPVRGCHSTRQAQTLPSLSLLLGEVCRLPREQAGRRELLCRQLHGPGHREAVVGMAGPKGAGRPPAPTHADARRVCTQLLAATETRSD